MNAFYYPGTGCWISDQWAFNGLRTVILENELLRIVVLADKGTDIVEFRYKPRDTDFLLQLPGGIRNPRTDVPSAYTGATFLDYFSGGWNEVLPNGGPLVNYRGAELGQHGEVSLVPWNYAILALGKDNVSVRFWVNTIRTPFTLEKTLTLRSGKPVLEIEEVLTSNANEPVECMWGHHIAFGRPFLDEGAVISTPGCKFIVHGAIPEYEHRRFMPGAESAIDRVPGSSGESIEDARVIPPFGASQTQDMAYMTELDEGWYAVTNPARAVGFGLRFDHTLFKYVWYWQEFGSAAKGYPWWGHLHTTALEPWTSYPTDGLVEAVKNGTALTLQPGEKVAHKMLAVAYGSAKAVSAIDKAGNVSFI